MSYNELFGLGSHSEDASLEGWWPLQDNAASTAVDDVSSNGNDGTLVGGDNTADITTTGPNNWLTAALDLDGAADYITASAAPADYPFSLVGHQYNNTPGTGNDSAWAVADASEIDDYFSQRIANSSAAIQVVRRNASAVVTNLGATAATDTWTHVGIAFVDATTVRGYVNGSQTLNDSGLTSLACSTGLDTTVIGALKNNAPNDFFDGAVAGVALFSRELSSTEMAEVDAGPEPINTVAPALSGTELVGETLTATSGTWALDAPFSGGSNGTVTYSYQWTRSDDDSGTNEADISGATSSTYVLTSSDAGKYIRCRVRATNDGGFDADADTNTAMSGKIATTALLANLDAYYKLDETSGTVVRNEVRTLVLEDHFDSGSTSGTYGDVPTGWAEYRASSPATQVTTYNAGSDTLTLELDGEGTGAGIGGIQKTSFLTVGNRYVLRTRFRVTEAVTGGPFLVVSAGSSVFYDLTTPTVGEWLTVDVNLGSASSTTFTYGVQVAPNTEAATVEIDSITIYQENAGTYVNSPVFSVPAPTGRGVLLDGSSEYANCGDFSALAGAVTVSLWVKETAAFTGRLVSNRDGGNNGVDYYLFSDGKIGSYSFPTEGERNIQTTAGDFPFDGDWHHVVIVRSSAGTVFYVDGVEVLDYGSANPVESSATDLLIGRYAPSASSYLNGSVDDVRIYARALDPADVAELYALGSPALADVDVPAWSVYTTNVGPTTDPATLTRAGTGPGADYDWTGVAVNGTYGGADSNTCQTPTAIATSAGTSSAWVIADHCGLQTGDTIDFLRGGGSVHTATVAANSISIGSRHLTELTAPLPADVARYKLATNPEDIIGHGYWTIQHNHTGQLYRISGINSDLANYAFSSLTQQIQSSSSRPAFIPLSDGTMALVGLQATVAAISIFDDSAIAAINAAIAPETVETVTLPTGLGLLQDPAALHGGSRARRR